MSFGTRFCLVFMLGLLCFGAFQFLGAAPALAAKCGAKNQRPCKVWERIPSCNKGLRENFRTNRCVKPKPKKAKKRVVCGATNQRPCKVWERIPSCNKGLVEDFAKNRCLKRAPRRRIACGAPNKRPCKVWERIPSCNKGLKEDFSKNRCVALRRGESPFFGGLASLTGEIAKTSELCKSLLGSLPSIQVTKGPVNTIFQCRRGYEIGYRCAAPKIFNLISGNARLAGRLDAALNNRACQKSPGPIKIVCALGKVIDDFAVRPALCMTAVVSKGGFTQLASGNSKTTEHMCIAAGEMAFEMSVDRAIKKRSRGRDNLAKFYRKLRKIKRVARKGKKLDRFFRSLEREPACRGVLN